MKAQPYKFAHELGHYLGLPHTWETGLTDPETGAAWKLADRFDLVYKPGTSAANPHVFYNDFAGAWGPGGANEPNLRLIHKRPCAVHCLGGVNCDPEPTSCPDPRNCIECCAPGEGDSCLEGMPESNLTCHIGEGSAYAESYTNGANPVKGLATLLGGTQAAVNVMTYRGDWKTHPYFVSDSQVLMIRKYLRWDAPLSNPRITSHRNTSYAYTLAGRRVVLGSWSFRNPFSKLDFNADGMRDLAVWIPPTAAGTPGRLKVLLSPGFSQSPGAMIDTQFGRLGDLPVPADYDGDGRTDFAVFQPGGGADRSDPTNTQAYWRWCLTSATPSSTDCSGISQTTCPSGSCASWGLRSDIPTPGLEFNTLPNELSVYRASNATWYWRAVSGGPTSSRSIGNPNAGSVPLPGDYDADVLADLVLYQPSNATYYYRRSQQGWNTLGTQFMGSALIPNPSGAAHERDVAIPMPMFRPQAICNPWCVWQKRLTFALFTPHGGNWWIVWDPFGTPQVDTPCWFGGDRADQPFTGFDINGDFRADMAIYRDKASGSNPGHEGTLFTRVSQVGACNGANYDIVCWWCDVRTRMFAVGDATGDAREDIVIVIPDTMFIVLVTSQSNFIEAAAIWSVNDPLAIFL